MRTQGTRRPVCASLMLLLSMAGFGSGPQPGQVSAAITSEDITEAVQTATDDKAMRRFRDVYVLQSRAGWGNGPVMGSFSTPFARIVLAAVAARKEGRAFSPSDVTPEMLAPELHVIALTQKQRCDQSEPPVVRAIGAGRRFQTRQSGRTRSQPEKLLLLRFLKDIW